VSACHRPASKEQLGALVFTHKKHLEQVAKEWAGCTLCELHELRDGDIMFGDGPVPAEILFISSAPTESDEEYTSLFTGDEGGLLVEILNELKVSTDGIYRTSAVACRPKALIPATEEEEERIVQIQPAKDHLQACRARLYEIIYAVDPRIIVTFGEAALQTLHVQTNVDRAPKKKISDARGEIYELTIPGRLAQEVRYPVFPTLDLTYLIKNPSSAAHGPINTVFNDLGNVMQYLQWTKDNENNED